MIYSREIGRELIESCSVDVTRELLFSLREKFFLQHVNPVIEAKEKKSLAL